MPSWFRRGRRSEEEDEARRAEVLQVEVVLARYPVGSRLTYGSPTRCPTCGDYGLVESVDAVACLNRCLGCGDAWSLTRRGLRSAQDPAERARLLGSVPVLGSEPEPEPEPVGALYVPTPAELLAPAPPTATVAITSGDLQVLLVEDDPLDAELVRALMEPFAGDGLSLRHARTRAEGERLVSRDESIGLVLLDLGLPDSNGLSTMSRWKPTRTSPPVVVLSGNDNAGLADAVVQMGASLFVHKHRITDMVEHGQAGSQELVSALRALSRPEVDGSGPAAEAAGDGGLPPRGSAWS
jgi:CheY-like chemotaxis protein